MYKGKNNINDLLEKYTVKKDGIGIIQFFQNTPGISLYGTRF
jgi:hypothetical protein